jgi:hypothetical protein
LHAGSAAITVENKPTNRAQHPKKNLQDLFYPSAGKISLEIRIEAHPLWGKKRLPVLINHQVKLAENSISATRRLAFTQSEVQQRGKDDPQPSHPSFTSKMVGAGLCTSDIELQPGFEPDRDSNPHSDFHGNAHAHPDLDCDLHTHTHFDRHANPNEDPQTDLDTRA